MIKQFSERFIAARPQFEAALQLEHPDSYRELVRKVIETVSSGDYGDPDANRIHEIDDGDYQGTMVYVIAGHGYQPSDYWYVKVSYGSCSGCDTLQGISGYSSDRPNDSQVQEYWTLALHIVQGLRKMGELDDEE